jgi:hypothetical protein
MKQLVFKRFIIINFLIIISLAGTSQSWPWAKQIGSNQADWGLGTCDKDGNFYIVGVYEGSPCYFTDTSLTTAGQYSGMFISKYSNTGQELWVQGVGYGYSQDQTSGFGDILVDNSGFLYVTGEFYQYALFDTILLHSVNNSGDMFLAKYNPDGTCVWAKSAGGSGNDGGSGLAIDSAGNVYVCGSNLATAIFDTISIIPGGFIAKYNSSGQCLWAKNKSKYNNPFFGSDLCYTAMTINKDNLYTCGYMMNDTILIDTILIKHPKWIGGNIVCCYDLNANIKWVGESASRVAYSGENISTDKDGNIYATGQFLDSISFQGTTLINHGNKDAFLCKYNPQGNLLWARQTNSTIAAYGNGIIPDSEGNCYATGWFQGTTKFGNDSIVADSYKDLFLAKYDSGGNFIGMTHFGQAEGVLVSLDSYDNPYIEGNFWGDVTIGQNNLTSYGDKDIFLAQSDKITGLQKIDYKEKNQLIIYANPTTGKCNITIPEEFRNEKSLTLTVYDNQGKVIQSIPVNLSEGKIRLDLSAQATGIYNAVLTNGKKSYAGRIVFSAD